MIALDMGISPCPNDTFIFHAMIENLTDTMPFEFHPFFLDVQELNRLAFAKRFDITKLSFYAWLKLRDSYEILDAGSALGRGCGPLLVARSETLDLSTAKVAIPGELTTAFLLLQLWNPGIKNIEAARFDAILSGVQTGRYDAGLSMKGDLSMKITVASKSLIWGTGGKMRRKCPSLWGASP